MTSADHVRSLPPRVQALWWAALAGLLFFLWIDYCYIWLGPPWPRDDPYAVDFTPVYFPTGLMTAATWTLALAAWRTQSAFHLRRVLIRYLAPSTAAVLILYVASSVSFVHYFQGERHEKQIVGTLTPRAKELMQPPTSFSLDDLFQKFDPEAVFEPGSSMLPGTLLIVLWLTLAVFVTLALGASFFLCLAPAGRPPPPKTSGLFLSYRRKDSASASGRIRDHLVAHFGHDKVYMDVDSIPGGVQFPEHIRRLLLQSDVFLAIIGNHWLDILLDRQKDAEDWVRTEIELALTNGTPLIPVLVEGAAMPDKSQLPDSLRTLINWNARPVRQGDDFASDIERLLDDIEAAIRKRRG